MNERDEVEEIKTGKFKQFKGAIAAKADERLPVLKTKEELDDEQERLKQIKTTAKIRNLIEIQDLKGYLKSKVGSPFCTNVLRIALNFKEMTIASTLVAFYNVHLDEKMLVRAIKTNQMQFIYCVWAFNKNYERVMEMGKE